MGKSPGGTEGELGDPLPELVSVDMSASIEVVGMQDGAGRAGRVDAVSSGCSVRRGRWLEGEAMGTRGLDCTRATIVVMRACRTRVQMDGDGVRSRGVEGSDFRAGVAGSVWVGLACARQVGRRGRLGDLGWASEMYSVAPGLAPQRLSRDGLRRLSPSLHFTRTLMGLYLGAVTTLVSRLHVGRQ